ncbi:protein of unknown function; putative exported protein [Methylorubrum extorquens DM4]|uniref:Uncharacterized protein n=1 Tax=Methylorubrum extorquens (strain DSM 6343 / CIP 106787 / DM4) TaxID=661410 RepID=C7C7Y0_METED|nr:hypothetical protein [Methylorubrum extorquens]CAX21909.1 protein of unknown function; putative exported protein [Methylorubrum extorquens DM4]
MAMKVWIAPLLLTTLLAPGTADASGGNGWKEHRKEEKEFYKEREKRAKEFHKERRKRSEEYHKERAKRGFYGPDGGFDDFDD